MSTPTPSPKSSMTLSPAHAIMNGSSSQKFKVKIHIIKAESLIRKNFFGSAPNPYCKIHLDSKDQKQQTSSKPKTLFPIWNEIFYFENVTNDSCIYIRVFDKSAFKPENFLGMTSFQVKDFLNPRDFNQTKVYSRSLKPRDGKNEKVTGTIVVALTFKEARGSASGEVASVVNGGGSLNNELSAATEGLPEGWEARLDHLNRVFYVNTTTGQTQWTSPTTEAPVLETMRRIDPAVASITSGSSVTSLSLNASASPSSSRYSTMSSLRSNDRDRNNEPLPSGWEQRKTPDGRVFFIDHNRRITQWEDPRKAHTKRRGDATTQRASSDTLGPLPEGWEMRTNPEGRVYYIDHLNRRTQWEDPRAFSKAVSLNQPVPKYIRDFASKYHTFRAGIPVPGHKDKLEMRLRRKNVFEDTYRCFAKVSSSDLRKKLWIVFDGEEGLDYGGITREWFQLLSKQVFNPSYCLFEYSSQNNYTLQISANSDVNPEHLNYFFFIGRVIGAAVYHGKFIDAFFVPSFYKRLLSLPITLTDIASVDPERYNSLLWMLENDITNVLYETFSVQIEKFGERTVVELKPGGSKIDVTQENKREYVDLYVNWRTFAGTEEQMKMIIKGFSEVVDLNLVKQFDHKELEYLISGLPDVNIEDWQKNTIYKNYSTTDSVVQWFWILVKKMSAEEKARLLQFVTGTSRIPATGFKDLWGSDGPRKFCLEKWGTPESLPRSHTCFNRLDLPPYESYEILEKKLEMALEQTEGFGIE